VKRDPNKANSDGAPSVPQQSDEVLAIPLNRALKAGENLIAYRKPLYQVLALPEEPPAAAGARAVLFRPDTICFRGCDGEAQWGRPVRRRIRCSGKL
jgi:hypothetical protein